MKLNGICMALHGDPGEPQVTTSVVQADSNRPKQEIKLVSTDTRSIVLRSAVQAENTFRWLRTQLGDVMWAQKRETPDQSGVMPFVFGSGVQFNAMPTALAIQRAFPKWYIPNDILLDPTQMGNPNQIPNMSIQQRLVAGALQSRNVDRNALHVILGNFVPDPTYEEWSKVDRDAAVKALDQQWEAELRRLKEGAAATREELIAFVRERIKKTLGDYTHRMVFFGVPPGARFLRLRPHPGIGSESVAANLFADDFDLREAAVRLLIEECGLKVNFCIKGPGDKQAPPFVDIVGTHLADWWDMINHGEVRPSAVLVQ